MENKLVEKIRQKYQELVEEEKDHYIPGTNYRNTLPPDNSRYCKKAEELVNLVLQLSKENKEYYNFEIEEYFRDEVEEVRMHKYKYAKGSNMPTGKSKEELVGLMRNATKHIGMSLIDILGDI